MTMTNVDQIEQKTRLALAELDAEFKRRAQPLLRTLTEIEKTRPPAKLLIDLMAIEPFAPQRNDGGRHVPCNRISFDPLDDGGGAVFAAAAFWRVE